MFNLYEGNFLYHWATTSKKLCFLIRSVIARNHVKSSSRRLSKRKSKTTKIKILTVDFSSSLSFLSWALKSFGLILRLSCVWLSVSGLSLARWSWEHRERLRLCGGGLLTLTLLLCALLCFVSTLNCFLSFFCSLIFTLFSYKILLIVFSFACFFCTLFCLHSSNERTTFQIKNSETREKKKKMAISKVQ